MKGNSIKKRKVLGILDVFWIFICITSLSNVLLLSIGYFYPILSLVISLLLTVLLIVIFRIRVSLKDNRFTWIFLLIIAIALLLRLNPNLYITGGQDQGTYVSMSKQYEVNHSLYIEDELRETLTNGQREIYDKYGDFLGIESKDLENSTYIMPFYPVLPSWLATFATLFGSDNRVYALTLFSILSIVGMYLFAYEISGKNKKIGLITALLISLSPLHVYFSRIPLTEILSLGLLMFSLYYLVRFYNDYIKGNCNILWLILSLLSANVFFYTRMTALLLLPVIVLIPLVSYLYGKRRYLTKYLLIYSIVWILSLLTSYAYYYFFIPNLFSLIVNEKILDYVNTKSISIAILLTVIGSGSFFIFKRVREWVVRVISLINRYLFLISILIFVSLIAYELWIYVREIFIEGGYTLFSDNSLSLLKQLAFLATFLYLTPIGFLLLPIALIYLSKRGDVKVKLLILTILVYLIYSWGVLRLLPYHYYFARYQFSELIPFCFVLLAIFLYEIYRRYRLKWIVIGSLVVVSIHSLFFSVIQLRSFEGADEKSYEYVENLVKEDDLLLVTRMDFTSFNQVAFPMKYYYGINVFPVRNREVVYIREMRELKEHYENIYILTDTPIENIQGVELVKEIDFKHNYFVHCNRNEDRFFEMENHSPDLPLCEYSVIPTRYYYGTYKTYLYVWE